MPKDLKDFTHGRINQDVMQNKAKVDVGAIFEQAENPDPAEEATIEFANQWAKDDKGPAVPRAPVSAPMPKVAQNPKPAPEKPKEQEKEEEQPEMEPSEFLAQHFKNAPPPEQIEAWKQEHGSVFIVALSDTDVFIWRPLRRIEYKAIMRQMEEQAQQNQNRAQEWFEEQMVGRCIVWSSLGPIDLNFMNICKAWTVTTLAGYIMESSNFVAPGAAMGLVRKL